MHDRESKSRRGLVGNSRGQVLVFFLLIFITMLLVGVLAVAGGQMLVRRQQAQMIVDSAAFAGASRQAEGLNSIARINEDSIDILHQIGVSMVAPYVDDDETTWLRIGASLGTPVLMALADDWAGDRISGYQSVFDSYDHIIDITNCLYSTPSFVPGYGPRLAANDVIEQNFAGGQSLFRPEDLEDSGVADPSTFLDTRLVELTDPEDYELGSYWYLPWPANSIASFWPFGAAYVYGNYIVMDFAFWLWRQWNPISLSTGRFYENGQDEVRFAYYLQVSSSPVIFGKTFFKDLPPITVAAAAKPYGGYLGDTYVEGSLLGDSWDMDFPWWSDLDDLSFNPFGNPWTEQNGKEASATYKAKLVPLTDREIGALALSIGSFEDPARWLTVLH
jgi:hypothetical protein